MRILIIGSGGREHALAWRLALSPQAPELYASPGNPGIARFATCLPAPKYLHSYANLAQAHNIDLTVVGPEAPLVAGIVDDFRALGLHIIGPTQAAALLEGSKIFAKEFFERASIPTARSLTSFNDSPFPIVIKADGLAAGKGVVIARDYSEAVESVRRFGADVIMEEYLEGEEVSFIGLSNGHEIVPFAPTQDHKRLLDGDLGPNTGGMGAYVDNRILTAAQTGEIMDRIMLPALAQIAKEGSPFTGFLYAGLMMTTDGPKVLEFNVRLGDPETQVLMHGFEGDLAGILDEVARGGLPKLPPPCSEPSVCVVLAASGYPDQPKVGDLIQGIDAAEEMGATVFHSGTAQKGQRVVTAGGRVLGVTAKGDSLSAAISNAYRAVGKVHFDGAQYRTDIGQKGLRRW